MELVETGAGDEEACDEVTDELEVLPLELEIEVLTELELVEVPVKDLLDDDDDALLQAPKPA